MRGRILSAAVGVLTLVAAHPAAAQAPEPYRVGMTAAITGPFSAGYAPTYEAYRTYFKRVNEAGGINGHPVVITYEDDRGEPQRAAAAAKKLTDGALLLINASISPTYKPVMTEAEASKTPLLFGGGVCPREAFPPAAPLIFCTTSFGSKWDSRMALGFIKEQSGTKKVRVGFAAQDIPLSRIAMFIESLPIHAEITKLVQGQTNHPAHYMAEGWTSAMVLEAGLRKCGWPCTREKLAQALSSVSVDTRGLRGGPIEMTADNHYRRATYYKVYRWDAGKNAIVSVGGWSKLDIK